MYSNHLTVCFQKGLIFCRNHIIYMYLQVRLMLLSLCVSEVASLVINRIIKIFMSCLGTKIEKNHFFDHIQI